MNTNKHIGNILPEKKDYSFLIGQTIGNITVLGIPFKLPTHKAYRTYYVVVHCHLCNSATTRQLSKIYKNGKLYQKYGNLPSCYNCKNVTHQKSKTRLHKTWLAMKHRCGGKVSNKSNSCYINNNIKVCDEWKNSFLSFERWCLNNGYFDQPKDIKFGQKLSLDRIDSYKDYSPDNCRWIPMTDNIKNVTRERDKKINRLELENKTYLCLLSTILYSLQSKENINDC